MGTLTDKAHVPGEMHSSSQLSRLCHACQSVLTRDDLQVDKNYPHHISPEAFVEANRMKCYICSHVFTSLGSVLEDIQEILWRAVKKTGRRVVRKILKQAAQGKAADGVVQDSDVGVKFLYWMSLCEKDREPGVSFANLQIEAVYVRILPRNHGPPEP